VGQDSLRSSEGQGKGRLGKKSQRWGKGPVRIGTESAYPFGLDPDVPPLPFPTEKTILEINSQNRNCWL